jgi:hypothetical protein
MRLLPLLLLIALVGCGVADITGGCADELVRMERDREGPLAAFHYIRNCGATTDYVTQVAIGPAGRGLEGATPVFVAVPDADTDTDGHGIWLEMHWTAPHQLSIAHAEKARVFKRVMRMDGARIRYRATTRMTQPMVD